MVRIPIRDVAAKLHRSEGWVATELHEAGIRSTDHIYSLSVTELEALVAYLRRKWHDKRERAGPTSSAATASPSEHQDPTLAGSRTPIQDPLSLTPAEQREIAVALLDVPEEVKAALIGPKSQLRIPVYELRAAASKKSSKTALHGKIIRFVRSAAFRELQASLADEAARMDSSEAHKHLGVATVPRSPFPPLESNPMAVFSPLPTDWWREQE